MIWSKKFQTEECIDRPSKAKISDINPENFGCKVVSGYVITENNTDEDTKIELNTRCVTGEDGHMVITAKGSDLKHVQDTWYEQIYENTYIA